MRLAASMLCCVLLLGCADLGRSGPPVATKAEMQAYLIGKTKDEIRDFYGRPPSSAADRGEETEWTYMDAYRHPDAPKSWCSLSIVFRDGKAVRVY